MRTEYEKIKQVTAGDFCDSSRGVIPSYLTEFFLYQADTANYQNVRGPRMYEDNTEFLKNREYQERRMEQLMGRSQTTASTAATSH